MVFVFTAVILFFTILFWTIGRFNKLAERDRPNPTSQIFPDHSRQISRAINF